MANPDEDVDKKVEDIDSEEVENDDKENVEDVDKEEGEDSDADSLDERINPAPGFEDYNFPEDPEKWTVEDLGEVWIHEKLSETEDSDDEIIDDTESSSEDTDDVSTDISGLTSEEEDEEEEEEEEEEGGGRGERGEGGGGGEEVGVGGGGKEEEEEEEYDDDLDDFTSDDDISYISSSDDEPSDPWLKFQKRNDPHGYEEKDLNEGFGWDPDMAGNESKKAKRIDDITEEDFEEFYFDDEDDDGELNYVPYHRTFPVVPVNWYEVSDEHEVVEELDRIEEALVWFSFVFDDGCTYEGTIWDDLAQGKGVFTTPLEICRYEGEWHQNMMEGHGVLEVDIPDEEPAPDSELAEEMRKQGKILKADYMSPEDREWLIKDINDSELKTLRRHQIYDNPEWIEYFGEMPERGHYRYAGQWKHGRMHGCGVYEVNRRLVWGRFYFGEMESDPEECTAEISAMHASLAEVAAAKARMFVNKPDGMVRELKGPYSDPQHPYMYDEEDVWMAPGFINQFYEVPEVWQRYVHDVDQERQMWLDSYYKSPLRIPMPAELEKWWWDDPEFLVISDIKDPDREVLIHLPTNRLINWTQDPEGHVRLFWDETGENKPDESFLPLDFDEFVGEEEKARIEEAKLKTALEENVRAKTGELQQKLGKKKNNEEEKRNRVDLEFRFLKVQEETEVLLDDVENQVDNKHVCEETVEIKAQEKEPKDTPGPEDSEGGPSQDYEEEEEEDDEDEKPRSFGTVASAESQCDQRNSDRKMDNRGPSTPPTLFASLSMVSMVAMRQLNPLTSWLKRKQHGSSKVDSPYMEGLGYSIRKQENSSGLALTDCPKFINYPLSRNRAVRLKAGKSDQKLSCRNTNFLVPCTELGFSCHVLSHTRSCLSKPNKSYGRKKCQGNEKREQKPSRKYSNKQEKIALIFSLSIPVEELG